VLASGPMWMSPEDARSDFILAGATVLFAPWVIGLVARVPFYPSGFLGSLLLLVWILVATALVPVLLMRYRDQDLATGIGLAGDRSALSQGLAVAAPIVLVGWVQGWLGWGLGPVRSLLGRLGVVGASPVVGEGQSTLDLLLNALLVAVLFYAGLVLVGFLTTRARDAFARTELPLVEGLRTFGMGAAAAALLLGLLASIGPEVTVLGAALSAVALAAVVLLTDRLVATSDQTSRATLLAPAIMAVIVQVMASGGPLGGLVSGNLLLGLFHGALSGGLVVALAALIETRRYAWAVVPVAVAASLYPTCMGLPTAFNASFIGAGC
jgi:hypothetical protein